MGLIMRELGVQWKVTELLGNPRILLVQYLHKNSLH
jgi:hypothetical protein